VLAPKVVKGDFAPGFSVDNFVKDMSIALEEAEAMKLSLPGLALVKQLYLSLKAMGKGSSVLIAMAILMLGCSNKQAAVCECEP